MLRTLTLTCCVVLLFALNILSGPTPLPWSEAVDTLCGGGSETARFIILDSRLPAAWTALLSGAALAVG